MRPKRDLCDAAEGCPDRVVADCCLLIPGAPEEGRADRLVADAPDMDLSKRPGVFLLFKPLPGPYVEVGAGVNRPGR